MGRKVMVVDDSRTMRLAIAAALAGAGFELIEAADGLEGLERIEQNPDLAVVLCDVNMPRMNGLDMLSAVKRDAKNAELPIVMLTTEGQPAFIARAKAAGAKGWIVKPFKPELLLAAVRKLAGTA
jgi:two-component system chemotaxis response regulator CheY